MTFMVGEGKKAQSIDLAAKLYHVADSEGEDGEGKICIEI